MLLHKVSTINLKKNKVMLLIAPPMHENSYLKPQVYTYFSKLTLLYKVSFWLSIISLRINKSRTRLDAT